MKQKTALITGATSGIGAAFARLLGAQGYDLILHGRRQDRLKALAAELRQAHGVQAEVLAADLSREQGIAAVEAELRKYNPAVLINNAGYGDDVVFEDSQQEYHTTMLRVHDEASLRLTHAALAGMRAAGEGVIINVSSIAGLIATGGNVSYNATKAYLVMFSEALSINLRGSGVKISALCPGFTHTEFHSRIGMTEADKQKWSRNWMDAGRVAALGWRAAQRGRVVYVPGWRNKLMVGLVGILPRPLRLWLAALVSGRQRKP